MYLKLLIDGIARQTTVLLAQLSTNSGARAPLSRLADQVFLSLAQEIEAQGISKAVVADMFGLALRSYQKKTRRLEQSATETARTLWEAVYDYIREEERERQRIIERFRWDGEREVGAVLSDLLASGLIYATGNAQRTVYGVTSAKTRQHVQATSDNEALANVIWLKVFHEEAKTAADLERQLGVDGMRIAEALEELAASDRVQLQAGELKANNVVIRVGADGKEAAMLDHFQAVAKVIAKRASASAVDASEGGATFMFSIFRGHPFENEVKALFQQHRAAVAALWNKVSEHNKSIDLQKARADQVTFYLGQITQAADHDEGSPGTPAKVTE
jgi:hypothetical protein